MSGFAERLLARGAGRPVGLPLLALRPAARFEAEGLAAPSDHPVTTDGEQAPAVVSRKPGSASREQGDEAPLVSTSPPAGHEAALVVTVDAEAGSGLPPPPDRPLPRERETAAMDRSEPPPPPRIASIERRAISGARSAALPLRMRMNDDHPLPEERSLRFDEPEGAPLMRDVPAVEKRPPPAPTISIGQIDVQFLPREQPLAPPRAEPQRTRGFDTYARARRGLPR